MKLIDKYKTIKNSSEGLFKNKGSKFIAKAHPVQSEEEIKEIINQIKKNYHDARHHCYAYRIGADKKIFRANDDGEPSNSAGKPILGQIMSFDLTNVLIVVIRYFGGTKLGVPGLINAYKTSSKEALEQACIIEKTVNDIYEISFDYIVTNDVMKLFKQENISPKSQEFGNICKITISVRQNDIKSIIGRLEKIDSIKTKYLTTE